MSNQIYGIVNRGHAAPHLLPRTEVSMAPWTQKGAAQGAHARVGLARLSPPVWRILAHSLHFGLSLSIADLLLNFYLVSLGYAADTAGLLSTVGRGAGMVLGVPMMLMPRVPVNSSLAVWTALAANAAPL